MTDKPTDPSDANQTTRFDPPDSVAPAAEASAATPSATESPATEAPPGEPIAPSPSKWRSRRSDPGRMGTIVMGFVLLVIGMWFFADQTLGLELPRLGWSQIWPILLIAFGAWIALGAVRRG